MWHIASNFLSAYCSIQFQPPLDISTRHIIRSILFHAWKHSIWHEHCLSSTLQHIPGLKLITQAEDGQQAQRLQRWRKHLKNEYLTAPSLEAQTRSALLWWQMVSQGQTSQLHQLHLKQRPFPQIQQLYPKENPTPTSSITLSQGENRIAPPILPLQTSSLPNWWCHITDSSFPLFKMEVSTK